MAGCSLCDSKNQTKCIKCDSDLFEFDGSCLSACPDGYSPNFFGTSCTKKWSFNFSLPDISIPYPHYCAMAAAFFLTLIS